MNYGPPVVSDAERMGLTRSLTLAKDVRGTVVSWNSMANRAIKRTATGSNVNAPRGPVQNCVVYKPDMTPEQAQDYAEMYLQQISSRERVIEVTIPGELVLTPASKVSIIGTLTGFDRSYFVDHIVREISLSGGFKETLRLKNHSPQTVSAVY